MRDIAAPLSQYFFSAAVCVTQFFRDTSTLLINNFWDFSSALYRESACHGSVMSRFFGGCSGFAAPHKQSTHTTDDPPTVR